MRSSFAESTAGLESDELLTTGEAAQLLGVSRQHIVDLCRAGDLPYTLVGTHRRVRRRDVELLRSRQHRLTRDQLRSLLLSHAVAGRIVMDREGTLSLARQNLEQMRKSSARGSARVWMQEWESLLEGPLPELLSALTSLTPRSRELRQNTPFAGVLTEDERQRVLAGLTPSACQAGQLGGPQRGPRGQPDNCAVEVGNGVGQGPDVVLVDHGSIVGAVGVRAAQGAGVAEQDLVLDGGVEDRSQHSDLIANSFGSTRPIVTSSGSDAGFDSTSCGTWTKS